MKKGRVVPVFLAGLVLGLTGCSPMTTTGSLVGRELTPEQRFTLKDLKGDAVSLDQLLSRNKAVLLDFWATWCGYCVEAMPDLVALQQKNSSRGFTVLAVNAGESRAQAADFAEKAGLNFPVVLDEDMAVAQRYGIIGIPTSILIGADGRVLGEYHEYSKRLESDIEKALQ